MYHNCAIPDCGARIPTSMLMCRRHWFMVPRPLRDRVNDAWSIAPDMRALESPEYMAARQEAIDAVAALLRPSTGTAAESSAASDPSRRDASQENA